MGMEVEENEPEVTKAGTVKLVNEDEYKVKDKL